MLDTRCLDTAMLDTGCSNQNTLLDAGNGCRYFDSQKNYVPLLSMQINGREFEL